MKCFFLLCFLQVLQLQAQQVDVVIIGVSHNYGIYPPQNFGPISEKLIAFSPDAFYGEFLSREDEVALMDYWCKDDNRKRLATLRKNRNISPDRLPSLIDSLKNRLANDTAIFRLKTDLAHAYYLHQDVANAHFQYWQVFDHLQRQPNKALQQYVDDLLSPALDALLAFPIMKNLGISELIPMDNQEYDLNWSAAAQVFFTSFEAYKSDTTAAYFNALQLALEKRNQGFEKLSNTETTSRNVTEWLNTDEASAIMASGDFYLPEMYELDGFPKEEMLAQLHWWVKRNQGMCDNVVKHAGLAGRRKVVIIAGANHRKVMQDIFTKMPDVRVRNINDIN